MKIDRHGLSIGIERINNNLFISFKAIGTLTHSDYEIITPMLEKALNSIEEPKIKAFVDCTEFKGWELEAAWDDFKLGINHGDLFEKIAILGNDNILLEYGSKITSWFIHGEVKYYEDLDDAIEWLNK